MTKKISTQYCLLESAPSVEDFLKTTFHCSSNRLKKYFEKAFLNKSMNARATLDLPLDFLNAGEINPVYEGPSIETVYEDENFLVLNKPFNLFVHPLCYTEKNNCLSFIRTVRPDLLSVNVSEYDRGLLYRLDYETSGVLVYVKKEEAYKFLRENFKSIAKKKTYHCLVEGDCRLNGEYTHYFSSGEEKGRRVIVKEHGEGNAGTLKIKTLEFRKDENVTLIEVELGQGLRHQIRAQLAFMGHAILGDTFYGGKSADRLYLNASNYEISFQNQTYNFVRLPSFYHDL